MKKITLFALAILAMTFASCGNKTQQAAPEADTIQKTFEQEQIEAGIKMHLDSIVAEMNTREFAPVSEAAKKGEVVLSDEEKKVKPDYLYDPAKISELTTIAQKYSALAILLTDKEVAKVYDMDITGYEQSLEKLTADINDPALKTAKETEGSALERSQVLYQEMDKEGRINFYWIASAAFMIEDIYLMSQNTDKFIGKMTDEQAANVTFRLICVLDGLDRLAAYDPAIPGIAEGLEPLKELNATSVEELKSQLTSAKDKIAAARESLLK